MNECAFIIFGATGDLTKRKLIPALYHLIAKNALEKFIIVGAALESTSMQNILESARPFIDGGIDQAIWQRMQANAYYEQLDFNKQADFERVAATVAKLEAQHALQGNRLLYLAVAASFFCPITQNAVHAQLVEKLDGHAKKWHRIVYEKPFGHDAASAHAINECIKEHVYENQAYRIDHYLTKELVSNIALIRFTNCVFEPLWNNRYIDNVQIILSEQVGVENRGGYYDAYGALRDVVQNHMLELLALIAMEAPEKLTGDFIRDQRAKALKKVRVVDYVLGQYEGYTKEHAVAKHSTTETFAALYLMIDNPRWAGVPFYLKTGKCLDKKETVIHVKFKQVDCLLTKNCPSDSNYLTIRLSPDESFILTLNAKKPGTTQEIAPVSMEYCHSCRFIDGLPSGYETLLEEVMRGEQSVSVRFDEIEYAWNIIDAIKAHQAPVHVYEQGGKGPEAATEFAQKHGMRWRS
jgi:glucose-6-phosphate 1-dehydrogenase